MTLVLVPFVFVCISGTPQVLKDLLQNKMCGSLSSRSSFVRCAPSTTTTQATARKKRRGIVEKRRRDRINSSLSELRRLVPTASEKQGSAKLEKAEILQMTVDHLKMLQAEKGNLEGPALALDFLSLGFRECVTEVSRFLSSMEGLDSSSPLHSRLLSHLSSCSSQRDALAAASHQHPHPYMFLPHPWAAGVAALPPLPYLLGGLADARGGVASFPSHVDPSSSSSSLALACTPAPHPALSLSSPFPLHRGFPILSSFSCTAASSAFPASSSSSLSSSNPHRPWGSEVGAF
uniref:Hes-related family bHLH transcription factor with YRPW motif 2 n=1 Tax=Oryzias sinensis TaxID=183150 RepID=A0A8C7Y2V1_9TELE